MLLCCRSARSDQPGQHVLHELHRAGADAHAAAARLLPLRQTQLPNAQTVTAVPRLRDGKALPRSEYKGSGTAGLTPRPHRRRAVGF